MDHINETELQEFIDENFVGYKPSDLSNIKEIVYDDAWYSHEESSGLFVFKGFDGNTYYVNYGHCVMSEKLYFNPIQINEDEALQMILEKEEEIANFYKQPLL